MKNRKKKIIQETVQGRDVDKESVIDNDSMPLRRSSKQ